MLDFVHWPGHKRVDDLMAANAPVWVPAIEDFEREDRRPQVRHLDAKGGSHMTYSKRIMMFVALGSLAAFAATPADAGRFRLSCNAEGIGDIAMGAHYVVRTVGAKSRKTFEVEFEAEAGFGFTPGSFIALKVDGQYVAAMKVREDSLGDSSAHIEFDTDAVVDDDEPGRPFPANFPKIGKGTTVETLRGGVRVLICTLQ